MYFLSAGIETQLVRRVLATHSIRQFPLHFPKPCSDKMPWHAVGPQAKLKGPHCYEVETKRAQSK